MSGDIPFAPSVAVMRRILSGEPLSVGKERARSVIAGGRLLTVPVEGGASLLKNKRISSADIKISNHGRWRQEHLGAWNAAYGKTPYFIHLFPLLEEAYAGDSRGSLREFNESLLNMALEFMHYSDTEDDIREMKLLRPGLYQGIIKDLETKVNINYSIFDALFRLGKESVFLI